MKKLVKTLIIAGAVSMVSMNAFAAGSASTFVSSSSKRSSSSSSSSSGGSGSSSSSSSSASSSGASSSSSSSSSSATVSKTLSNGQSVTVAGATTDASGNVTSGLVKDSASSVTVATGEAKRAGLPASVVSVLNDLDAGKLTSVTGTAAAGVANKQVLAQTVAIVHITAPSEQKLLMATSKVPTSGVVKVLFYNNNTGLFTIIDATVDASTGIVKFTAPADGTAIIIG